MEQRKFASTERQAVTRLQAVPGWSLDRAQLEQIIGRLIDERRYRFAHFPASLFSDPAWDILLALALAECRDQRLTISNLCDSVDAPMTTALRWINALGDKGLIVRHDAVNDRRRKFIELSPEALAAVSAYCSRVYAATPVAA